MRHDHSRAWARVLSVIAVNAALAACASSPAASTGQATPAPTPVSTSGVPQRAGADTAGANLVPPGFGSLRQDDIAIRIGLQSVQVRIIPLDETIIRLLSPDSYRALRDIVEGQRDRIADVARRYNLRRPSLWYVSYFGLQQEARFSPLELIIQSNGRDFRPLDFVPLTAGFREQRLNQRETQAAIFVFDEAVNTEQPLTVTVEGQQNSSWGATLQAIERERALVRSRASQAQKP